jgi:hypothetical protein
MYIGSLGRRLVGLDVRKPPFRKPPFSARFRSLTDNLVLVAFLLRLSLALAAITSPVFAGFRPEAV